MSVKLSTSIQRYTNGKFGFDFGSDNEQVLPILVSMSGAGYDEHGVRVYVCQALDPETGLATGELRYVRENVEHIAKGYCCPTTWIEITREQAFCESDVMRDNHVVEPAAERMHMEGRL